MSLTTASSESDRIRLIRTVLYYTGFVVLGMTAASLGPTLTGLAKLTGSTLSQISVLFTARSLGYLLGSALAGGVYDRFPGHRVMFFGLLTLGFTLALTPLMPLLWVLVAVLLTMGIAEGLFDVGGNTLLVWVHGERVGPYMNALHFFFGIGAFAAPIIIGQFENTPNGLKIAYWILAGLTILPAVGLAARSSPHSPNDRTNATRQSVQPRLLGMLMVFFFLYVGAEVSFGGWIHTYAQKQGLAVGVQAAYMTAAFWGAFTVGRLLSIPFARRFRPRTVLLADLVGCVLSVLVMLAWSGSPIISLAGIVGVGLSMASIFPTALLLAERRMVLTGFVTSLFFLGSSFGAMLVPFLIGQFFERLGPPVTLGFILAALILNLGVYVMLINQYSIPGEEVPEKS